ncbi:DUF4102 domain-containing protein [Pantoea allii]|nr:DUF4102 domain-containing protein [Pantoea allii]
MYVFFVQFSRRFRREGKLVQPITGDYPSISLSQAREGRQQFRRWITEGYDSRRQMTTNQAGLTLAFVGCPSGPSS